jgi:tetratricopeptide (TPR) repeat protein
MNDSPQLLSIFCEARERRSAAERAAYLDEACGGDAALRARVEELLGAEPAVGNFLQGDSSQGKLAGTVDDPMTERPGTAIGPYKLMEQIGEGGMGLVFVAEQQQPVRRKVALKVLKPGMDTRQVVARFEAERQALALMDHPHIAKVFDGGETAGGRPYFVMELVKGVPITEYCDQNQMPIRARLELFIHVCQAVQHAHQKGIIHRDLKPSNVLVMSHDGTPVVKVIDFGVAKAVGQQLTDKTVYTHFAQLIGTPLYMAPEQAGESGLDVDTRSDIYALGALLYELLTGTTPFDPERLKGASYDELRRIIREEEPPRPSHRMSTVGQRATMISTQRSSDPRRLSQLVRGELDWIVMKALEKDRNRRYETASAFAADVERYLADEPVQACPPSAWYRFRKFARRNRGALAVVGLILFFLVLLAGAGLWWGQQRAGAVGEARAALAEATGLLEEERWREALSAARRAEAVLAGVGADADLRRQARELIRDLEMAERLQEARLQETAVKDGHFDAEAADEAYAAAFAEYGLDVDRLDVEAAAEQIRSRPIHQQLVAALDDWARVRKSCNGAGWRQRLAVSRAADPDLWRNRLRDALEQGGLKALEDAAAAGTANDWPLMTVDLLGRFGRGTPSDERIAALLARAQQRHPGDFWINEILGLLLLDARPPRLEEAISFFRVAVALRPRSPGARLNLGTALRAKGQTDWAVAELLEAISLKNDYADAHILLGGTLVDKGRLDDGIAELRKGIRLKTNDARRDADAHAWLGHALRRQRRLDEAIAEYQEAMRLDKSNAEAHFGLGTVLHDKNQLNEAIAEFRRAIQLNKDLAKAHAGLNKDLAKAHESLGSALADKGSLDEAITECQEAVRLNQGHAQAHYNLGNVLRRSGRWDDAIAAFREATRLEKDFAEAHNGLGSTFSEMGRRDAAFGEFQEAIRLRKGFADPHCNLGKLFLEKGLVDDAIAEFREAIRLKKDCLEAHYNLGSALRAKGRLEEAIAECREAIRLKKDFPEAHSNLGSALLDKGQLEEAIAECREAIRLKKDLPEAHCSLGNALQEKGLLEEAIAECREAIRLKKDYFEAHYNLGLALRAKGRLEEAIAEYRKAIRLKKDYAQAHNNLGAVLHEEHQLDEAIGAFQEAIRLKKDLPEAHHNLGMALSDKARLEEAIAEFREAIRFKKDYPEAHYHLGIALQEKGRLEEAIPEYREAIRLKKDLPEAHYNLGLALRAKGLLEEAIDEFREAIRLKNDYAKAHNNLGAVLHTKGRLDEAIGAFREAIRLKPDLPEAHCGLGNALRDKGRLGEAIPEYREAIRLKNDYAGARNNLGIALWGEGQLEDAAAEFRECLRIEPEHASAHCNLGRVLQQQGDLQRALQELRRGHELGSRNPRWRSQYPSAVWVRQCERFIELDGRLSGFLIGATKPASSSERIELAQLCLYKQLNRAAVRFFEEGFAGQPGLAEDLWPSNRYDAACAAVLAAAGHGKDADKLDGQERARLRRQALDWLRADLAQWIKQMENGSPEIHSRIQETLAHWQKDRDLATVRGEAALAKLPADEQPGWRQLWADVEQTLARARQENKRPEKSTKKQ